MKGAELGAWGVGQTLLRQAQRKPFSCAPLRDRIAFIFSTRAPGPQPRAHP